MILDDLTEAADIVHQTRQYGIGFRPSYSNRADEQPVHTLFHETKDMLRTATHFGLCPVVGFLGFCQRTIPVSFDFVDLQFSHMTGIIPRFLTSASLPTYPASRYKDFPLSSSVIKSVTFFESCTLADDVS